MSVVENAMKLKIRAAILICRLLSFCALFLILSRLSTLYLKKHSGYVSIKDVHRTFREPLGMPHIFKFRERLNKSNYSSDNNSPEIGKQVVEMDNHVVEMDNHVVEMDNHVVEMDNHVVEMDNHVVEMDKHAVEIIKHAVEIKGARNNTNVHNVSTNIANRQPAGSNQGPLKHNDSYNYSIYNETSDLVEEMLNLLQSSNGLKFNFQKSKFVPYYNFLKLQSKRTRRRGRGLRIYVNHNGGPVMENWEKFHKNIHQFGLYDPDDPAVNGIMEDLANQPIVDIEMKEGGTQLKLILTFTDEGQALFKPMRYPRDEETRPDHFYFVDFERHNAEIAAFHLDRILGFFRVPPTVGREVNITYEIKRLAEPSLKKTFFISPANNVCFHAICSYYCDTGHAVCGHPAMLEGSFAAFLPPEHIAPHKAWRNPWKRSYSKHRQAYWEIFDDLCVRVQEKEPYSKGRRLLDIIDMHIFDFLTGNMDRHHYETFSDFGNETFLLHLDNGRGFGRSQHDELSILAPVYQCCMIRHSTFMKLTKLYLGPEKLSTLMRDSMMVDRLSPILTDRHLRALDRRVVKILATIQQCIQLNSYTDVVIDDFF